MTKQMGQKPFFNTQLQNQQPSPQKAESLLNRKTQLGTYVSNLDQHIHKAMNFQNRILVRKKQNLLDTLQKMKDQVYKQSQKTRKMQQFFYIHCEKILNDDINKWDGNMDFFKKLFQAYDFKIKQKRKDIENKKLSMDQKTIQLKQLLKSLRKAPTVPELTAALSKKHLTTEQTTDRLTRVKTETSLPSLSRQRMKTFGDTDEDEDFQGVKNYMKPIKTQKNVEKINNTRAMMMEMIQWYRDQRGFTKSRLERSQVERENWFQKVIFVERNYRKIKDWMLTGDAE